MMDTVTERGGVAGLGARAVAEVWLDFDARQKRRQIVRLDDGREVRIQLERLDTPLDDGEVLVGEGLSLVVRARPERLIEARGVGLGLVRAAFHLGNRHAKVMVGEGWLRTADDPVMGQMLRGMGLEVAVIEAVFVPEIGAYHHHGPGHGHDEAERHGHGAAKIHRFQRSDLKAP
jgi:urease accessory protein